MLLKQFIIFLLMLSLTACAKPQKPLYQEQLLALGALVDITIWGVEPELAKRAGAQITEDFNHIHSTWHAWQASALTRLNECLKTTKPCPVDAELLPMLKSARELSLASGHLFNPALGKLIALWGYHSDERVDGPPPAAQLVAQLVAQQPTMGDLLIEGNTLRSANPALQLDVGGIGQGYAADLAIKHLRELGIHNAIINASGDIRVIGKRGARPWRIGIRDPRGPGIIASVELQGDESIVTSGDYERYFTYQGQRYHHILDPRSGYPSRGASSVTVVHDNATTADAASTALMIAGPDHWHAVARAMGVKQVMLIATDGSVHLSPALAKRIHFEQTPEPKVRISAPL